MGDYDETDEEIIRGLIASRAKEKPGVD